MRKENLELLASIERNLVYIITSVDGINDVNNLIHEVKIVISDEWNNINKSWEA